MANVRSHDSLASEARRAEVAAGQEPFAIILGCSDSRVPAEIVFDQGLGDLFVIRVAGNIVAPSQVGSVEFAAERYGTRLVVVLGHSQCGAILATIDELTAPGGEPLEESSFDRRSRAPCGGTAAADRAAPAAGRARPTCSARERADSVGHLTAGSEMLEQLIEKQPRCRRRRILAGNRSGGILRGLRHACCLNTGARRHGNSN